jgi:trans-aconitate methyltransferase
MRNTASVRIRSAITAGSGVLADEPLEFGVMANNNDYFSSARLDLFSLVEGEGNRVLELGCGLGKTGALLKKRGRAAEVIGIELNPEIARSAQANLDDVICGDVERLELGFSENSFDYIVAGDVLEHLIDPWAVLRRLRPFVKVGGAIVTSIPNIRNWRILVDLMVRGDWKYCEEGLLDRTHLRFFTRLTIIELLEHTGYEIDLICPAFRFAPKSKSAIINQLSGRMLEPFITRQYLARAKRSAI